MDKPIRVRKKPVVVEAMRFVRHGSGTNHKSIQEWAGDAIEYNPVVLESGSIDGNADDLVDLGPQITIKSREGEIVAKPGDWIIKGVEGEFYPCGASIFDATYDYQW